MTNREGFWYSECEQFLPMPVADKNPWKGKREFLGALDKLEKNVQVERYRGSSTCRICGVRNGSYTYIANGWEWPDGFRHYVEKHNVRPSLAFQEMVLGRKL